MTPKHSSAILRTLFSAALLSSAFTAVTVDAAGPGQSSPAQNKARVAALLDSFNTGDSTAIAAISQDKYIQHNLAVADGLAGLGEVMKSAPPQGFKAKTHRLLADGNYVVAHTEYDFFGPKAGFDVFRFENGLIVEHWDNLTAITPPNPSGRTQFDGATEVTDLSRTEANKRIVTGFVEDVLMGGNSDKLTQYISTRQYLQHNSSIADGLDGLGAALKHFADNGLVLKYEKLHKVLGEGNFVLAISEGRFGAGDHVAYYDLFRLEDGLIVEHWDVIESIPPRAEWQNQNGKF